VAEAFFVVGWSPLMVAGMISAVVGVLTVPPNAGMAVGGLIAVFAGLVWARIVGRIVFGDRWA